MSKRIVWPIVGPLLFVGILIIAAVLRSADNSAKSLVELCVQHTGLRAHYHPRLSILIEGDEIDIPQNIGITHNCMRPVHTHDASGTLHVETPDLRDVYLRDFFTVWGKKFDRNEILEYAADENHRIRMTVDGQESQDFENLILKDGQDIRIYYEEIE